MHSFQKFDFNLIILISQQLINHWQNFNNSILPSYKSTYSTQNLYKGQLNICRLILHKSIQYWQNLPHYTLLIHFRKQIIKLSNCRTSHLSFYILKQICYIFHKLRRALIIQFIQTLYKSKSYPPWLILTKLFYNILRPVFLLQQINQTTQSVHPYTIIFIRRQICE